MDLKSRFSGEYPGDAKTRFRWQLPYGEWICRDGREVLYDRKYCPVVQRYRGQPPTLADPTEWVYGIVGQKWIYDDGTPNKLRRAQDKLDEWGVRDMVEAHIKARIRAMRPELARRLRRGW
jgi:hypothetical protein